MLAGRAAPRTAGATRHVKEALDLCLACKGCKGDCPVSVDMATYKAEFLSHYYAGRLRPRSAYAIGLIHWWARLASHAPRLANAVTQTPVLRDAGQGAGRDRARAAPAPPSRRETFTQLVPRAARAAAGRRRRRVLLWPDTFNNHFHPETARAAVEVLERAGYRGRPCRAARSAAAGRSTTTGMLDLARAAAPADPRRARADDPRPARPIVGLEPSCVAVFRDELPNLFPDDEDAQRLRRQTFTAERVPGREETGRPLPRARRQGDRPGRTATRRRSCGWATPRSGAARDSASTSSVLDSGCCGMAGAFGFEAASTTRSR